MVWFTTDLPIEALRADDDRPACEIINLCSRITDDIIALETAALRKDTAKILEVLARIGRETHGIETLQRCRGPDWRECKGSVISKTALDVVDCYCR